MKEGKFKIGNFDEALEAFFGGGYKYYTNEERRRIFRRRPPEWIARWKSLYIRKRKLIHKIRAKKRLGDSMEAFKNYAPNGLLSHVFKKDSSWSGKPYQIPFNKEEK